MQYGGIANFYEQFGGICQKYSRVFDSSRKRKDGNCGKIPQRSRKEIQREVKEAIVSFTLFFNKNGLHYDTNNVRKMDGEEALMFFESLLNANETEKKEMEKINGTHR